MPGTRFPQPPLIAQPTPDNNSKVDHPPPGTNMELLDIDGDQPDDPCDFESPVTSRYPQRDNRHPPRRFDDFVSYS